MNRALQYGGMLLLCLSLAWACGIESTTLREYLSAQFWRPFAKGGANFAKKGVPRLSSPYAGMDKVNGSATAMGRLRATYQGFGNVDSAKALASARAVSGLSAREREEIDLLDAKFDMRAGSKALPGPLLNARRKLQQFLRTAKSPDYLSEARGWLAYTHYLVDEQSAAGKIYLDELNRKDSNLSQEVLLNSLRLNYGFDGGPILRAQLPDYFDTAEHAAFAIQLVTNPGRNCSWEFCSEENLEPPEPLPYARIRELLEKHAGLLRNEGGANTLAILAMRTALRAGDPTAALRLAAKIPSRSAVREDPDYLWMLASARFLSKDYIGAETPLLRLAKSSRATETQKAAARYGLCGVYMKTGNRVEQLRFSMKVNTADYPESMSIYWANSGWDRSLLLEAEAPIEALHTFLTKYPQDRNVSLVRYSLAVRLARENRYTEAAEQFDRINAKLRAGRMRRMAELYAAVVRPDAGASEAQAAKFQFAVYMSENSDRLYFNDRLWSQYQRYALTAESESRFTREERARQIATERKLKDDQEELWRAHLLLREVVRDAGRTDLGRRSAELAIRCVRRLSDRFGRTKEIAEADITLTRWLRSGR